jgi:tryptophan synthase alpha chain
MELNNIFDRLAQERRKALIAYLTAFYPSQSVFEQLVITAADAGADIIEIGLPFSDPLADGPVIQHSSHYALTHGFTINRMFDSIKRIRTQIKTPLVIMTYINPVLRCGVRKFIGQCSSRGVSGLIIPDMIPEEGEEIEKAAQRGGIAMNYLIAPTTPLSRIKLIASRTTCFIYLVSVTGTTGERKLLPAYLPEVVRKIRQITDKPLCIGFGISTPFQAKQVARLVDGVIIGTALVKRTRPNEVRKFLKQVRNQLQEIHRRDAENSEE